MDGYNLCKLSNKFLLLFFQSGENEIVSEGNARGAGGARGAGSAGGFSSSSSSASETRLDGRQSSGSGRDSSLNVILGAAQGPGDYHGTMSKAELEREAGGRIFTSGDSETRSQVERTRYQGSGGVSQQGSRTAGGSAETYQGTNYGRGSATTGGSYQGSSSSQESAYSSGGYRQGGGYRQEQSGQAQGARGSYNQEATEGYGSSNQGAGSSYQGAGSSYQGSGRGQQQISSSSSAGGAYGAGGGGSVQYEEGSYYDQSNRGRYTGSGAADYSSTASSSVGGATSAKCKYVWSDVNSRWECEGAIDPAGVVTDQGSADSGWVTLPDGTRQRSQSAWSSWNSTGAVEGGAVRGAGRRRIQGGKGARRRGQGVRVEGEETEEGAYFESGHIGEGKMIGPSLFLSFYLSLTLSLPQPMKTKLNYIAILITVSE